MTYRRPTARPTKPTSYDPTTRSRFWGVAGTVVDFEQIAGGSGITDGASTSGPDAVRDPYHGLLGRLEQQVGVGGCGDAAEAARQRSP
jgi:hypothetical protein